MLKYWIGGAVAVALAVGAGAFGFYTYAQSRVLAAVESQFDAARASGATATHGAVAVDVWNRSVSISDVAVVEPVSAGSVKVARVNLDGIAAPWSTTIGASKVTLVDVVVDTVSGLRGEVHARYGAPQLIAENVERTGAAIDTAAAELTSADALTRAVAAIAMWRATKIALPTLSLETAVPFAMPPNLGRPPLPGSGPSASPIKANYVYKDVTFETLHDGIIDRASVAKLTLSMTGGPFPVSMPLAVDIDGMSVAPIDVQPMFGLGLRARSVQDGYYRVYGPSRTGVITVTMPGGAMGHADGVAAQDFLIDPTKISYAKIRALSNEISGLNTQPSSVQQAAKVAELLGTLYEGVQTKGYEISGLRIEGSAPGAPGFGLRVGSIKFGGLSGGKLEEFRISDIDGGSKLPSGLSVPFKLGSFALQGFDIARLMRTMMTLPQNGQPASPAQIGTIFSTLEGFEIVGVDLPMPIGQVRIDTYKGRWGKFVDAVPSAVHWTFKGTVPLSPTDPTSAVLRKLGVPKLDLANEASLDWVESDRLVNSKFDLSAVQLGAVSANTSLGNVPRSAFSTTAGQFAAVAPGFEIGPLSLTVHDQGAVALWKRFAAQTPPPAPPAISTDPNAPPGAAPADNGAKPDALMTLRQQSIDPTHPAGNFVAILDGVSRFIATPGQTMSLKLIPKGPVNIADVSAPDLAQRPGALVELFEKFNVDVQVAP